MFLPSKFIPQCKTEPGGPLDIGRSFGRGVIESGAHLAADQDVLELTAELFKVMLLSLFSLVSAVATITMFFGSRFGHGNLTSNEF